MRSQTLSRSGIIPYNKDKNIIRDPANTQRFFNVYLTSLQCANDTLNGCQNNVLRFQPNVFETLFNNVKACYNNILKTSFFHVHFLMGPFSLNIFKRLYIHNIRRHVFEISVKVSLFLIRLVFFLKYWQVWRDAQGEYKTFNDTNFDI